MPKILNRPTESSLMSNYSRSELAFVRGKGVWLFDKKGGRFLDLASGIAVNSLGHSHPRLIEVLADQGSKVWHTSNLYTIPNQEKLATLLTNNTFADKVFFTNSGAESVECAIKIARRFFFSKEQSERNYNITDADILDLVTWRHHVWCNFYDGEADKLDDRFISGKRFGGTNGGRDNWGKITMNVDWNYIRHIDNRGTIEQFHANLKTAFDEYNTQYGI